MKKLIYWSTGIVALIVFAVMFLRFVYVPGYSGPDAKYAAEVAKNALSLSGVVTAQELTEGFTEAKLFMVTSGSKKYVVRFFPPNKHENHIKRVIEHQRNAERLGYGPRVYYANVEKSVVIMEYLKSKYSSYQEHLKILLKPNQPKKLYVELAHFLQKIHRGPKLSRFKTFFADIKRDLKNAEARVKDIFPIEEVLQLVDVIHGAVAKHLTVAPCHNDLHPNNLFFLEDGIKAIDYDDFEQSNPYFDIAAVAIFYCLDPAYERTMLSIYLNRQPSSLEEAKLYLIKQVTWISFAMKFLGVSLGILHRYYGLQVPLFRRFLIEISEAKADLYDFGQESALRTGKIMIQQVLLNAKSQKFKKALDSLR